MSFEDGRLTRAEMWEVMKSLKPDLTWPEFLKKWNDFQRAKARHALAKRGLAVIDGGRSA